MMQYAQYAVNTYGWVGVVKCAYEVLVFDTLNILLQIHFVQDVKVRNSLDCNICCRKQGSCFIEFMISATKSCRK